MSVLSTPIRRAACPICGSTDSRHVVTMDRQYLISSSQGWKLDPKMLNNSGIDLSDSDTGCAYYQCDSCGNFFLRDLYALEEEYSQNEDRRAQINELSKRPRSPQQIIHSMGTTEMCLRALELAAHNTQNSALKVLDYGCGGGYHLKLMSSISPSQAFGYAPYDYDAREIHKTHPTIPIISTPEDLETHGPFDLIWCNQVLEHVYEPNQVIEHIRSSLRPGGVAYISAPGVTESQMAKNVEKIKNGILVKACHLGHVQIWNRNKFNLALHVESKGFKILPIPRYSPSPKDSKLKSLIQYWGRLNKGLVRTAVDKLALKVPPLKGLMACEFFAIRDS